MSTQSISPEITFSPEHASTTKVIWKTFWILSGLTVAELCLGLAIYTIHKGEHPNASLVLGFKALVCILTMAKAFYIVSIFMHLGNEVRNFIMTITVTLGLFVWFIIAFLWDGSSWRHLRNTDAGSVKDKTEQVQPAAIQRGEKQ